MLVIDAIYLLTAITPGGAYDGGGMSPVVLQVTGSRDLLRRRLFILNAEVAFI